MALNTGDLFEDKGRRSYRGKHPVEEPHLEQESERP
jgi:hypothetical protein